ncbi:MAG: hypothetical protein ACUZ8E_17630 [Candidatus Anammoxibacter sp.]
MMTTDELIFRLKKMASVKGVSAPHLLVEACHRMHSLQIEVNKSKQEISAYKRQLDRVTQRMNPHITN